MFTRDLTKIFSVCFVIAIITLTYSCSQKTSNEKRNIKLGAILTLSGNAAESGKFQQQGVQLALEELNSENENIDFSVEFGDSKNGAREGLNVFKQFIELKNMKYILSTGSAVCLGLSSLINQNNVTDVVLMTTVTSAPGVPDKNSNIFRGFVLSEKEAPVIAEFAIDSLNANKFAVFYINDDYGLGADKAFKKSVLTSNSEIVFSESYDQASIDFKAKITRMMKSNPDAVYVVGYDQSFGNLLKQLRELGYQGHILSTALMPAWAHIPGEHAKGIYYTSSIFDSRPNDPEVVKFNSNFKQKFGTDPTMFSASTYTLTKVFLTAIANTDGSIEKVVEYLDNTNNFSSPVGTVNFNEIGNYAFDIDVERY